MAAESRVKVWRASRNSDAGIRIDDEKVQIIGSSKSAIEVNKNGVGIVSKSVSFGMSSSEIRTGGMFTMGDEFTSMIPSTIVTLIPQRLPFPPLGFIMGIVPVVPVFMAVFAATQVGG
jgi:hypothetical protein